MTLSIYLLDWLQHQENKMSLPDFIIIGAMKAATTSLHYYLNLHPQISMSREKELNFFVKKQNWRKGIAWYKSNFNSKEQLAGEASPNYTNFPFFKGVPERMHAVVPDIKLTLEATHNGALDQFPLAGCRLHVHSRYLALTYRLAIIVGGAGFHNAKRLPLA